LLKQFCISRRTFSSSDDDDAGAAGAADAADDAVDAADADTVGAADTTDAADDTELSGSCARPFFLRRVKIFVTPRPVCAPPADFFTLSHVLLSGFAPGSRLLFTCGADFTDLDTGVVALGSGDDGDDGPDVALGRDGDGDVAPGRNDIFGRDGVRDRDDIPNMDIRFGDVDLSASSAGSTCSGALFFSMFIFCIFFASSLVPQRCCMTVLFLLALRRARSSDRRWSSSATVCFKAVASA